MSATSLPAAGRPLSPNASLMRPITPLHSRINRSPAMFLVSGPLRPFGNLGDVAPASDRAAADGRRRVAELRLPTPSPACGPGSRSPDVYCGRLFVGTDGNEHRPGGPGGTRPAGRG